jgi:hypothetical protein
VELSGQAVEVREQAPLVDAHEVELVAQAPHLRGRHHELGQRVGEAVLLEEAVGGLRLVRAEGEGRGLGDDAGVERGGFEQAGEGALVELAGEQLPGTPWPGASTCGTTCSG